METRKLAERLEQIANNGTDTVHPVKLIGLLCQASVELQRLDNLINNPHTDEFLEAVKLEAAHQRERWSVDHDGGKTDPDWFWLVGHLAGKAVHSGTLFEVAKARGFTSYDVKEVEFHEGKRLHHVITTAAALLNWHANLTGNDTRMRPGISPTPDDEPK